MMRIPHVYHIQIRVFNRYSSNLQALFTTSKQSNFLDITKSKSQSDDGSL